jgi:hypothetical protein
MTKISNQYSLTNILTADLANSRLGINNVSPAYSLDLTGTARVSTSAYFATASGSVGIGTTSPTRLLDVSNTSGDSTIAITSADTTGQSSLFFAKTSDGNIGGVLYTHSDNAMVFRVNDAERMRITSAGDVSINSAITDYGKLNIKQSSSTSYGGLNIYSNNGTETFFAIGNTGSLCTIELTYGNTGSYIPLSFRVGGSERMRITSGGALLVGLTTASGAVTGDIWTSSSIYVATASSGGTGQGGVGIFSTNIDIGHANGTASGTSYLRFIYNGSVIGSITQNSTTGVLFNINSDYRLKEDLKEIKGLDKISAIKVYDYKWKASDDRMDGVLAHELQQVLPYAVTGIKDGEDMQGVDYSKIVPVLIKSIQELSAENTSLINRIEALENK